jgi:glutathione S-transferase
MHTLYIANKNYSSWSLRPWILMKERGIAFEERLVPFGSGGPEGFRSFSPSGRVPCLVDGAVTVWDSLAIVEYLAETWPTVWPADRGARAWARRACAEMHSGFQTLRNICSMNCGLRVKLHENPPALQADWRRMDELWCDGLRRFGGPYLAGAQFTAADAFFAPVALRVRTYSPSLGGTAAAYAARLLALPNLQAWYAAGIAEPWRDEAHDAETRAVGQWLQDLRG